MTTAPQPTDVPCPAGPPPPGTDDDPVAHARAVAFWNDAFRTTLGRHPIALGRVVATRGVAARGRGFVDAALAAVAAFDAFTPGDDPHGARDFGVVAVHGVAVWFKLDAYDLDYAFGSGNPADPAVTRRALTLLLPDEY